jgi:predicted GNAT family N-acyltransferase
MGADAKPPFTLRVVEWAREETKLRAVRIAVFVIEQNIPEQLEWDAHDAVSIHALAEDASGMPIGCGRLLPDGHIGRLAVLSEWRGRGVGAALLERLIALARTRGDARVLLNAQVQAMPFYARYGFEPAGEPFVEADLPHQTMERFL